MRKVSILQEYIPQYRVAFFNALRDRLSEQDVQLALHVGRVARHQAARGDSAELPWATHYGSRSWTVVGKRIVFRDIRAALKGTELIVSEQARRNSDLYALLCLPRAVRPLVGLWGHGRDVSKMATRFERILLDSLTQRADWFFAYTEGAGRRAIAAGYPENRVTIVQNSFDWSGIRLRSDQLTRSEAMQILNLHEIGLTPSTPVVGYLGALAKPKRLDMVVAVAGEVQRKFADAILVVAGAGPEMHLVEAARSRGLRVAVLGRVGDLEKAALSKLATCLLIPDQVGLVALDSLAMGVPIVTARVGRHGPEFEYLSDGVDCLTAEPSVDALARQVIRLAGDPARLNSMGRACLIAAQNYTMEAMVENFAAGIQSALEHARPHSWS